MAEECSCISHAPGVLRHMHIAGRAWHAAIVRMALALSRSKEGEITLESNCASINSESFSRAIELDGAGRTGGYAQMVGDSSFSISRATCARKTLVISYKHCVAHDQCPHRSLKPPHSSDHAPKKLKLEAGLGFAPSLNVTLLKRHVPNTTQRRICLVSVCPAVKEL